MEQERVKCLIIGSGPAGYTAAIYAGRANLQPVLYTGMVFGGQLTITTEVENFPGYPQGVAGPALMEDLRAQAAKFGADIRFGTVSAVDFSSAPQLPLHRVIIDDEKEIVADAVIIATGATAKYLNIPSEKAFAGMGVSACATCDGFFYKGKDVAVVGGGDTACEEATYLSGLCNKVYLIVRKNFLRASEIMQDKVMNTKNIEVLFEHNTKEIYGDQGGVCGVKLWYKKGTPEEQERDIAVHGFFLAIGHTPNTEVFKKYIHTDEVGYIVTQGKGTQTNVAGVFAAGDVMDPDYRQGITAAASGCKAAIDAERYLTNRL
ncbi:thioredoxin reductase [Bacteroidia bacterium]|nr:thioredoxin reductase [Bacteroidia bacterium]